MHQEIQQRQKYNKAQYIQQLQNQNIQLKQKYAQLSHKYQDIKKKLIQKIQNGTIPAQKLNDIQLQIKQTVTHQDWDIEGFWTTPKASSEKEQINQQKTAQKSELLQFCDQEIQIPRNTIKQQEDEKDNFSNIMVEMRKSNLSKKSNSTSGERHFPLIEGCFILQKKNVPLNTKSVNALLQMAEFAYPDDILKTQKQTLEMIIRYLFAPDLEPTRIKDDEYDSRRNQIVYGTPFDDFSFAFEDHRWNNKKQIPDIMKQMGTMKKKYVYILLKPQIVKVQKIQKVEQQEPDSPQQKQQEQGGQQIDENMERKQILYETDIIYGFISPFPLRTFFQQLHRAIQNQVKYAQLKSQNTEQVSMSQSRKFKYEIIGQIMQKIVDQKYKLKDFPIRHTYKTGVAQIKLDIPSIEHFKTIEDQYFKQIVSKYNFVKVAKLLHYVLAERFILVQAKTKKMLNQIMQMIRIMIKPFFWIFAVVYCYSQYFQPFLSSPMPIIIGKLTDDETFPEDSDMAEFDCIIMSSQEQQLKQKHKFYKSIKRLKKHYDKQKNSRQVLIHRYVKTLKNFIIKGILDVQPTDFHIQFMDTQMVSYYKDLSDSK